MLTWRIPGPIDWKPLVVDNMSHFAKLSSERVMSSRVNVCDVVFESFESNVVSVPINALDGKWLDIVRRRNTDAH